MGCLGKSRDGEGMDGSARLARRARCAARVMRSGSRKIFVWRLRPATAAQRVPRDKRSLADASSRATSRLFDPTAWRVIQPWAVLDMLVVLQIGPYDGVEAFSMFHSLGHTS
ncbi:hypothetical protein Cob_v002693 [Colletotrichum orbiculare MAFF 240422]|uniref:Uncharacterized protein n=1 Tax=Colletotrichum orbiculare (strain 104-T / ATCC 96160 / CBS 514.97 / LARS 414 / MAFF 240422) TaxID=1213857 RepID=A0A484G1J4_COLOR|nr:hypothetical protein Cob_v002693 [Colletotrichum orbiculare MAFF 240422]